MAEPLFFESTGESRQPASAAFCPGTPLTGQAESENREGGQLQSCPPSWALISVLA